MSIKNYLLVIILFSLSILCFEGFATRWKIENLIKPIPKSIEIVEEEKSNSSTFPTLEMELPVMMMDTICDSLMVMEQLISSPEDSICQYAIDLINQTQDTITGICVELNTANWMFNLDSLVLDTAYMLDTANVMMICFEHANGIPSGDLQNVLQLSLQTDDPTAADRQEILFNWYKGEQEIICTDTIFTQCAPPAPMLCTPVLTCPEDTVLTIESGLTGLEFNYPMPMDTNNCENIVISCDPPSGSFFGCGTTTINCMAVDTIRMDTILCSFDIVVECDTAMVCEPVLVCPNDTTIVLEGGLTSIAFDYPMPIETNNCEDIAISCTPASGSLFECGITTVTCMAIDTISNDTTTCSFEVVVNCDTIMMQGCCTDSLLFNEKVEAGFLTTLDSCGVTVSAVALDSCHQISYDFGDGNGSADAVMGNRNVSYTYAENGTYTICATIEELNDESEICFSKDTCFVVSIRCSDILFQKLVGDSLANEYNAIQQIGDFIYAAGSRGTSPDVYGIFSRFSLNGDLDWTVQLDSASVFNDFVATDASATDFLVVGRSAPYQIENIWQDNQSILSRIDSAGNIAFVNHYDQTGREEMARIVRVSNPSNAAFPFYISGAENVSDTPSAADFVNLFNVNINGVVNWKRQFAVTGAPDNNFYQNLLVLSTGNLALFGSVTGGTGYGLTIDGDGKFVSNFNFDRGQVMLGASAISGSTDYYIVGETRSGNFRNAFIARITNTGDEVWSYEMDTQLRFTKIEQSNNGEIYVIGQGNETLSIDNPNRFMLNNFSENGSGLTLNWTKFINNNESAYSNASFEILPSGAILYADNRNGNPLSFGNSDALLGVFDAQFNSDCTEAFTDIFIDSMILSVGIPTVDTSSFAIAPTISMQGQLIDLFCEDPCGEGPCMPSIICPNDTIISLSADTMEVAVNYALPIDENACDNVTISCDPPSGTLFACDTTLVTCMAIDTILMDTVICTFNVIVNCEQPEVCTPVIACPSDTTISLSAGLTETVVNYALPIDANACENVIMTCDPPSGSLFACDSTLVTCTVIDTLRMDTTICSFNVIVECDTSQVCTPDIVCPNDTTITVMAGLEFDFELPVDISDCPNITFSCDPPFDQFTPCDTTLVTCTVIDTMMLDTTVCMFNVILECDTTMANMCCQDSLSFETMAQSVFDGVSLSCDTLCFIPMADTCTNRWLFNWGDGTSNNWNPTQSNICHDYNVDTITDFFVCMTVFEFDDLNRLCQQTMVCDTITITPCMDEEEEDTCVCGEWSDFMVSIPDTTFNQTMSCGDQVQLLNCTEIWNVSGSFACPDTCSSRYSYSLMKGDEVVDSGTAAFNDIDLTFDISAFGSGVYDLVLTAQCGLSECEGCTLQFVANCGEECSCGGFENISFGGENTIELDLACEEDAKELACPESGVPYRLAGDYLCEGGCDGSNLQWTLRRNNIPVTSGSSNLSSNPSEFLFEISSTFFSSAGNYSIVLTGQCGGEECSCTLNFFVADDCDQSDCTACGTFTKLQLVEGNGNMTNLECDSATIYTLQCPAEDRAIFFEYQCPDGACPSSNILNWDLIHVPTNTTVSDFVDLNVLSDGTTPLSAIPLGADLFKETGLYRLELRTNCGGQECICDIEFLSECTDDCNCANLDTDWYDESADDSPWISSDGTPDFLSWLSGCDLSLQPNNLQECDNIAWILRDTLDGSLQTEISRGNDLANFEIVSGRTYELQVTINRTDANGASCRLTYTAIRTIFCSVFQGFNCTDVSVRNGGFATDLSSWATLSGAPQYIAIGGSDGNGYVRLEASNSSQDALAQSLVLDEAISSNYLLQLDFNIRRILPGTRIVVESFAADAPATPPTIVGQINLSKDMQFGRWLTQKAILIPASTSRIAIRLESDFPDDGTSATRSRVSIDNIQVEPFLTTVPTRNPILYTDAFGNARLKAADVYNRGGLACTLTNLRLSKERFTCNDIGINEVTLTATSETGIRIQGTAMVTVIDTVPPTLICPSDIMITQCKPDTPVRFNPPTVLENCNNGYELRLDTGLVSGSIFPGGITEQIYMVEDRSGNTATCSFNIELDFFSLEVETIDPTCSNFRDGSIILQTNGGSGTTFYSWSTGEKTDTLVNLSAGLYVVTVVDGDGCSRTDSIQLDAPPLLSIDSMIVTNRIDSSGEGSITAFVSGGLPPYEIILMNDSTVLGTGTNFVNLGVGTYNVVVTDSSGCTTVSEDIIIQLATNTRKIDLENQFSLRPNPTAGDLYFNLQLPQRQRYSVELFDMTGRRMQLLVQDQGQRSEHTFDLSSYPAGIYFVKVQVDDQFVVKRIAVVRD